MKTISVKMSKVFAVAIIFLFQMSCKTEQLDSSIEKVGDFTVPPKGEIRVWNNTLHPSFTVKLTNNSSINACEVYLVENDVDTWNRPSLFPKEVKRLKVAKNGSVFIQNYSTEPIKIGYEIY
ncbi:MAG: hypothetical protein MUF58_03925 [Arcicella sp.]|jgi:hypothetical protein|nr:hypothetical protein [Arcicella sp.]